MLKEIIHDQTKLSHLSANKPHLRQLQLPHMDQIHSHQAFEDAETPNKTQIATKNLYATTTTESQRVFLKSDDYPLEMADQHFTSEPSRFDHGMGMMETINENEEKLSQEDNPYEVQIQQR